MSGFKSPALQGATSIKPMPARRVAPSGILHFTISVTDLDRARRFYEDIVGATFWRQNSSSVFMRAGEQYFVLTRARTNDHVPPNKGREILLHHPADGPCCICLFAFLAFFNEVGAQLVNTVAVFMKGIIAKLMIEVQ